MEFKGTKSPWQIGIAFQGETNNIKVKTSGELITVEDVDGKAVALLGRISELETNANALLISKSVDNLTGLQMNVDSLELSNIDFYEKYKFNVSELHEYTKNLIKEATEL